MKRKILSLITAAGMLQSLITAPRTAGAADDPKPLAALINLGDYVQMGTYAPNTNSTAAPILWRCVAFEKISGYDDSGNPITDSTQTEAEYKDGYLPLMFADASIIGKKAYDAGVPIHKARTAAAPIA